MKQIRLTIIIMLLVLIIGCTTPMFEQHIVIKTNEETIEERKFISLTRSNDDTNNQVKEDGNEDVVVYTPPKLDSTPSMENIPTEIRGDYKQITLHLLRYIETLQEYLEHVTEEHEESYREYQEKINE